MIYYPFKMKSLGLFFGMLTAVLLLGCEKTEVEEETEPTSELTESAESMNMAEDEFTNLAEWVGSGEESVSNSEGTEQRIHMRQIPECASVTISQQEESRRLIIDFGQEAVECKDGKSRKGMIITELSGSPYTVGSSRTTTLEGYEVNGHAVEGEMVITIEQVYNKEPKTNPMRRVKVSDASISTVYTDAEGNEQAATVKWNSDRTIEHKLNDTPFDIRDDEIIVMGSSSGVNRNGVKFDSQIIEPLVRSFNCAFESNVMSFVQGRIRLTNESGNEAILDYGDGECNVLMEVLIDGESYEVRIGSLWKARNK